MYMFSNAVLKMWDGVLFEGNFNYYYYGGAVSCPNQTKIMRIKPTQSNALGAFSRV